MKSTTNFTFHGSIAGVFVAGGARMNQILRFMRGNTELTICSHNPTDKKVFVHSCTVRPDGDKDSFLTKSMTVKHFSPKYLKAKATRLFL